jgi:hypothetical protein
LRLRFEVFGSVAQIVGKDFKQFRGGEGMAAGQALKVLLATGPRALLRSTLTACPFAKMRR